MQCEEEIETIKSGNFRSARYARRVENIEALKPMELVQIIAKVARLDLQLSSWMNFNGGIYIWGYAYADILHMSGELETSLVYTAHINLVDLWNFYGSRVDIEN